MNAFQRVDGGASPPIGSRGAKRAIGGGGASAEGRGEAGRGGEASSRSQAPRGGEGREDGARAEGRGDAARGGEASSRSQPPRGGEGAGGGGGSEGGGSGIGRGSDGEGSGWGGSSGADELVFVTGATGLLGGHLVRELLSRGHRVRALVRERRRGAALLPDEARLELVVGDLGDVAGFAAALTGVTVVFHAGAYFREAGQGGSHERALERINVEGTRALIAAAYAAGVRSVLHVSSIGTLAPSAPEGRAVDEGMRIRAHETRNAYYRSKVLADAVVEEALEEHRDLWAAFVLPGYMNGPGDSGPTAAGRTIQDFVGGRLPGVLDAHFSYVDARDVAWACVEAARRGKRGRRYIVAGQRASLAEEYAILERVTGVVAPTRRVPMRLLGAVALVQEAWARLSGRPVLLGLATYRLLRDDGPHGRFDSSRAERELGVRFRPLEETLADAVRWLDEHGMLEGKPRQLAAQSG